MEQYYCVPRKQRVNFSGTTTCPWNLNRITFENTYRFQEEDAADGTSSVPCDPGRSTRQFPPFKHHRHNKPGYKNALS